MRRSTKMLLGIGVALVTAASLHWTVGERFHRNRFGYYDHGGCARNRDRHAPNFNNKQSRPAPAEKEESSNF
ncbi:hypothetical protein [Dyadobacter bucti]|uniref:hypothetical protein n=1 Tax=Dyadobacter bucti TaxID=2572203 RepID=UPI001108F0CC|nr:hypothetical protein [Dyadobacter bucti]